MVNYLAKRPNFDILKILFAKRLILVEGPTEEMFINTFLDKEVFEKAREFILETESRTVKGADGTEYIYYGILEVKKE